MSVCGSLYIVGKHHVLHTGCLHSNHTAQVQGHHPQHLLQENKTRRIRMEVETERLSVLAVRTQCAKWSRSVWSMAPFLLTYCGPQDLEAQSSPFRALRHLSIRKASTHWGWRHHSCPGSTRTWWLFLGLSYSLCT